MQTLNKLLDMARKTCPRDSDRALSQALKVTATTILGWRNGSRRITDEHLMAVIDRAQADPALAVLVRQEMAETKAEKKAWSALWDRLSPVTTVIGAMVLLVGAVPSAAKAETIAAQGFAASAAAHSVYYVMPQKHLGRPQPYSRSIRST
ncbi:DUF3693 domain-containing protein [Stenotrophomonas sp.]|uniref:DUF3693 domain-containing protein n=1 Tax=Stenotrophomonas sp. TaxID=69392 RepID=UPI00289E1E66|nr:DUF3693 domain-containing protein [Stenotrophomonas sp.]